MGAVSGDSAVDRVTADVRRAVRSGALAPIDELWKSHHDLHLSLLRPAALEWDLRILGQLWQASDRYNEAACLESIAAWPAAPIRLRDRP